MSLFCCSCNAQIAAQVNPSWNTMLRFQSTRTQQQSPFVLKSLNSELHGQWVSNTGSNLRVRWSFLGGSRVMLQPEVARIICGRRPSSVTASWLTSSQIACNAFTLGTIAVLPFYTLMVVAPNARLTKKAMESSIPYVVLGALYAYLLYLSWTPDTLQSMFASKYWLPELPGITKMFSNEMTMASAWIHLLAVDLYAARQVFRDGLKDKVETRHSVSLCLLFCPIGIATHVLTKVLTRTTNRSH